MGVIPVGGITGGDTLAIDGAIADVVGLVDKAGFAGTVPDRRGALGLAIGGLAIGGKSTKLTIWGRLGGDGGGDGMGTITAARCSKVAKPTAMGGDNRSGKKREIWCTVLRIIINNFHANSDWYDLAALTSPATMPSSKDYACPPPRIQIRGS
jgi:hypothetical protein